jgi:hypothetical protein
MKGFLNSYLNPKLPFRQKLNRKYKCNFLLANNQTIKKDSPKKQKGRGQEGFKKTRIQLTLCG